MRHALSWFVPWHFTRKRAVLLTLGGTIAASIARGVALTARAFGDAEDARE